MLSPSKYSFSLTSRLSTLHLHITTSHRSEPMPNRPTGTNITQPSKTSNFPASPSPCPPILMAAVPAFQPPTSTGVFPRELMLHIFRHVRPGSIETCCHVSHVWRHLALQTEACIFSCRRLINLPSAFHIPRVKRQLKCRRHDRFRRDRDVDIGYVQLDNEFWALLGACLHTFTSINILARCLPNNWPNHGTNDGGSAALLRALTAPAPHLQRFTLSFLHHEVAPPTLLSNLFDNAAPQLTYIRLRNILPSPSPVRLGALDTLVVEMVRDVSTFPLSVLLHQLTSLRSLKLHLAWVGTQDPEAATVSHRCLVDDAVARLSFLEANDTVLDYLLLATPLTAAIQHISLTSRSPLTHDLTESSRRVLRHMAQHLAHPHTKTSRRVLQQVGQPVVLPDGEMHLHIVKRHLLDLHQASLEFRAGSIARTLQHASTLALQDTSFWHTLLRDPQQPHLYLTHITIDPELFSLFWPALPLARVHTLTLLWPSVPRSAFQPELEPANLMTLYLEGLKLSLPTPSVARHAQGLTSLTLRIVLNGRDPTPICALSWDDISRFLVSAFIPETALQLSLRVFGFYSISPSSAQPGSRHSAVNYREDGEWIKAFTCELSHRPLCAPALAPANQQPPIPALQCKSLSGSKQFIGANPPLQHP